MIKAFNEYERMCQELDDSLRVIENRLLIIIEESDLIVSEHQSSKDKLLYTLGKQKGGSSTGGLGFLIKHMMIQTKMTELREELFKLRAVKQAQLAKIEENLTKVHSKHLEKLTREELDLAVKANEEVRNGLVEIVVKVEEAEKVFINVKEDFNQFNERVKKSFITEVQERLVIAEEDITDMGERNGKMAEALKKFEQELEKQNKLIRNKDKKEEILRLKQVAQTIKDDGNEIKANINNRKNQLEKTKKQTMRDLEKMNLSKLLDSIKILRSMDNQIESDKKDVNDVERRVNDLSILFRDHVKSTIKELHNELQAKMNLRQKQSMNLQKKHVHLQTEIEFRRIALSTIQSNLEDDDKELYILFRKHETTLSDANQDEEQAAGQLRQILAQTERLLKNGQRISRDNFNQEEVNELLSQFDQMEASINQCDSKLEDGLKKVSSLEQDLKEMEKKVKNERINECEDAQKITFESLEKMKRLLDRTRTQINVIEKDQQYLWDEFNDLEKKKESLAFKQEAEKKLKEWKQFGLIKDKLQVQTESLEKVYEERQRNRETVQSNEFMRIKKESERIREEIMKVVEQISGEFHQEIDVCKEVIAKMVKKYRYKKDKFNSCVELKLNREQELLKWKDRVMNMRDRISIIEGQLNILGVNQEHEGVEVYKKFLGDIERLKQNAGNVEKTISKFSERVAEEAEDLELMESKVVKTVKLEEIEKALEKIGLEIENYEKELEKSQKFDQLQKQIEQEVEAFMNKLRSSQLFDCEQKIREVEDTIDQLIRKLREVGGEVDEFKAELHKSGQQSQDKSNNGPGKQMVNKDILQEKSVQFVDKVEQGGNQRGAIQKQLEYLKEKLNSLDKKTVNMNDISQILSDAQNIGKSATVEIKKMNEVQEELRQLSQEWKDKSKQEGNRQVLLQKAREQIRTNIELLQKVKQMLGASNEKVEQFDLLYKTMQASDDYSQKKQVIEKKMRRIAQIRSECGKITEEKDDAEKVDKYHSSLDLDQIQDLEQLQMIVNESARVNKLLQHDFKELTDMGTGFEKRRVKIADAEIRAVAKKRQNELAVMQEDLEREVKKLQDLERAFAAKQQESDSGEKFSPEKSSQIQNAIESIRIQVDGFKRGFQKVEDDIRNVTADITVRDLEKSEPVPKLARDIERLKAQYVDLKDLRYELEKIQVEVKKKTSMLSSIDVEQKVRMFLIEIEKEKNSLENIKIHINRVLKVAKTFDGYTSGSEDEEFFQVVTVDGQDLNQHLQTTNKQYSEFIMELNKIQQMIEEKKKKAGGNLGNDDIEDINDFIIKIETKFMRVRKTAEEIEISALQNKEKLSQHDLENKIDRRGQELEELERIMTDISKDVDGVKVRLQQEIDATPQEDQYMIYIERLRSIMVIALNIDSTISKARTNKNAILQDQIRVRSLITLDVEERLERLIENVELKRRIQECLKQIGEIHIMVKTLFAKTNEGFSSKPQKRVEYKFDPNDDVDRLFGATLNKLGMNITLKRLGGGYYMFGTKKIFCKIINGKLVVRVGGGFMGIEEFILQYGPSEQEKVNKLAQMAQDALEKAQSEKSVKNSAKDEKKAANNSGISITVTREVNGSRQSQAMSSPKTNRSDSSHKTTESNHPGPSSFLAKASSKQSFQTVMDEANKKTVKEETKKGSHTTITTTTVTTSTFKKTTQSQPDKGSITVKRTTHK